MPAKYHPLYKNLLIPVLLFLQPITLFASEFRFFNVNSTTEIEIQVYPAKGDTIFIWLYSEAGPQKIEHHIATVLSKHKIESWQVDLFATHFLPVASSSMDKIPATDIGKLIEHAHQTTGKKVVVVTTGRGTLPVLKGAHFWQTHYPESSALSGVILLSPKFYIETPDPGLEAKLLPIVKHTNLPVFIIQPANSPWYWKLDETIPALEKNGSDVFIKRIPNIRDRYYFRPDATEKENRVASLLPRHLATAASYLEKLPKKPRLAVDFKASKRTIKAGKKERQLKPYKGKPIPPPLSLPDMDGKLTSLNQYTGKVVLVNFWASWCPPCVHEMPSMERLQSRMGKNKFIILGINMAEERSTIQHFLDNKVNISFPILLDIDGKALKNWGVFAFPTSYVLDKNGHIRYALFGGVDWEEADILQKIHKLIDE